MKKICAEISKAQWDNLPFFVKNKIEALQKENAKQFQKGVEFCIDELRKLQDSSKFYSKHQKQWNFSASTDFAPVELSDYLGKRFKKHLKELEGGE